MGVVNWHGLIFFRYAGTKWLKDDALLQNVYLRGA